jgi:hypothetical protein
VKSGRGLLSWAALSGRGAGSSAVVSAVPKGRYETYRAYTLKSQRAREVVQAARLGRLVLTYRPAACPTGSRTPACATGQNG